MSENAMKEPEFEEAELLLPWYATGKLSAEEKKIVDAWLAEHPEAADRLEGVREEQHLTIVGNESIKVPGGAALTRFLSDIEAEGDARVQSPGMIAGLFGAIGEFMAGLSPQVMGVAAAACLGLLVVQATVIGTLVTGDRSTGSFETATGGEAAVTGPAAIVQFQETATVVDISNLLMETGGKIAGGPQAEGQYVIVFPADTDLEAIVSNLREHKAVIKFALPRGS